MPYALAFTGDACSEDYGMTMYTVRVPLFFRHPGYLSHYSVMPTGFPASFIDLSRSHASMAQLRAPVAMNGHLHGQENALHDVIRSMKLQQTDKSCKTKTEEHIEKESSSQPQFECTYKFAI